MGLVLFSDRDRRGRRRWVVGLLFGLTGLTLFGHWSYSVWVILVLLVLLGLTGLTGLLGLTGLTGLLGLTGSKTVLFEAQEADRFLKKKKKKN